MKKQGRFSTKMIILIPVFILGIVSVISSILAVRNIRKVNANATQIANGYMVCVDELGDIQSETEKIHRLGLSHIVSTDLNTMISLVDTIRSEQAVLDDYLAAFEQYVDDSDQDNYEAILSNYEGLKYEIANLMAYSANGDKEAAYALANGAISEYATAMQDNIKAIQEVVNSGAEQAKAQLASVYIYSLTVSIITIAISAISLLTAAFAVMKLVIVPLSKTQKEISEIIDDIDHREGDLTRRVTILSNQEVAAVGSGTSDQWERANVVSEADAQPGDLVFQRGPEAGSSNHVGIICGKTDAGDWIVVHCSSGKNGVTVGEAYSASFRYIRQPSFYPDADQVAQMRKSGEAITTAQFITGIDVTNNLQDLINANLSTSGDMDTVTIDPSGNGTVSPGSLYVANSLQELFEAGQHVSVFSQVSYGDAAEVGSQDGGTAGSAKAAQTAETDFSGIMVTNSLQELLSATIGIQ